MSCIACGKPGQPVRVLEVQTLHLRELTGARKIQALGAFRDTCVCPECVKQQMEMMQHPLQGKRKRLFAFIGIFLVGIVLLLLPLPASLSRTIHILAFSALGCGVLGSISVLQQVQTEKNDSASLSAQELSEEAAFQVAKAHLPAKDGENTLTYIPVNSLSLKRKNGDLMILYDLLPEIAKEAFSRLHADTKKADN